MRLLTKIACRILRYYKPKNKKQRKLKIYTFDDLIRMDIQEYLHLFAQLKDKENYHFLFTGIKNIISAVRISKDGETILKIIYEV